MNLKVIAYVLSRLQFFVTFSMGVPFVAALLWGEECAMDFAGTILISLGVSVYFYNKGRLEHENLTLREGIAITGIAWFLIPVVSALPFLASHQLNPVDSLFESFSGLTCTGGSVISDLDVVPRSLILWRGVTHWVGGLGIIVLFIALFPQPGSGAARMFNAEGAGPSESRVVPRITETANALLIMYVAFSLVLVTLLLLCGLSLFDSVNLAMSAVATGGFATTNGSAGDFNSLPVELVLIVFMLIGGGNFGLYFLGWKRGYRHILKDTEFRVYMAMFLLATPLVALNLINGLGLGAAEALRYGAFQMASIMTSTGLSTCNFDQWPAFSQYCIIIAMLTGGCAGSTAGGMKLSRVIILWKMVGTIIQEKLHPNSIARVRMEDQSQSSTVVFRVARFFFLYVMIALVAACFFNFDGLPVVDSIMLGLSCMGNMGVAFGAAYTFYDLPDMTKIVCCLCMVIGRLEIFTFLAMLQPGFWKRDSNW